MITQAFAAIDNKKPLVLIERPAEGSSPYAGIIYVRGSSSDNSGGSGVGSVEVNLDGQPYKKANPKAAGDWSTWTASFSIGSSGSHTILAKATDRAGNRDWDAVNFTIRSDTTDPIVAITAPLDGGTVVVSSTAKLTVKGKASDAGSGIGAVHIRLDKQSYIPVIPASTNDWSTWSATYSSVAAGAHTFTVRATDKAGNQEWDTVNFAAGTDTTQPVVIITTPADGTSLTLPDVEVTGTASDYTEAPFLSYSLDGVQHTVGLISADSFAFNLSGLDAGSHMLTVRADDSSGNSYSDSVSFTIINDEPVPENPDQYPIPLGFTRVGEFSDGSDWEFWGRYTTNYASGGSGPSQRWDNEKMNKLNMVAGYEFKIGPDHGTRGNDEISLKFPRCVEPGGERGIYDPNILWYEDGRDSVGRAGKEIPHPTTWLGPFNTDNPRPQIGSIKDGQWHGFLAVVYNDPSNNNAVTMQLWYNPTASGNMQDYIYLGKSVDTAEKRISPGPILAYDCDPTTGGTHPMQIRIDEIPQDQLEVRNMFAAEVIPPS